MLPQKCANSRGDDACEAYGVARVKLYAVLHFVAGLSEGVAFQIVDFKVGEYPTAQGVASGSHWRYVDVFFSEAVVGACLGD